MKRIILIAISAAVLLLSGCTKEYITYIKGAELETIILDVPANAWQYTNAGYNNYFFAEIEVPELTKDIYEAGNVNIYRILGSGKDTYQKPIQAVELYETEGRDQFYAEELSFDFSPGFIVIYFTISDFFYENPDELSQSFSPEAMTFRLVMTHPND